MTQRKKTMMPIKGYFARARVFGWIMLTILIGYGIYVAYRYFVD